MLVTEDKKKACDNGVMDMKCEKWQDCNRKSRLVELKIAELINLTCERKGKEIGNLKSSILWDITACRHMEVKFTEKL
jgi:hypothetical protein